MPQIERGYSQPNATVGVPADPRMVELLSYYRDAELHGAGLLLRLVRMMRDDAEAQVELTRHVAEETRHAWLWTKRITDLGAAPVPIALGYQTRIGLRTIPRRLPDLLALTVIVEERSLARYREHAARAEVDHATLRVLEAVAKDEEWHVAWVRRKLTQLTDHDADERDRMSRVLERYRQVDADVYAELRRREDEVFASTEVLRTRGEAGVGTYPPRVRGRSA